MKLRAFALSTLLVAFAAPAGAVWYEEGSWTPLSDLNVAAGETLTLAPPDCMTRTACNTWLLLDLPGDVRIDGTLDASAWQLGIRTPGRLELNGSILASNLHLNAGAVAIKGSLNISHPGALLTPILAPIDWAPFSGFEVFQPEPYPRGVELRYEPPLPWSGAQIDVGADFGSVWLAPPATLVVDVALQPTPTQPFLGTPREGFVLTVSPAIVQAVPEPHEYATLLAGLGLLGLVARRRYAV